VGLKLDDIRNGLDALEHVPGRLESVREGQDFLVLVDYAHTPDALERVLTNARGMTQGRLIVVFGCGGDRDPGKRPLMGKIAGELADYVVVTNDNPRTEDPAFIANGVMEGVRASGVSPDKVVLELDRRAAIGKAIAAASAGDVLVIAGKGHEDYQILGREKIHFDDREEARAFLRNAREADR
jgi:UDP-N-acetylmuramoyl-L-alanyl-D-glutamate--2,6-diaminopimelate ligase